MRLRNLRYFLAVAEEKSFTRAASRVHIDPSPLSRAVRAIEADMQVPLIHHRQGCLQLTRAGEAFREDARRILAFVESVRARVRAVDRGREQLHIGLADHLAQPPLIRLLARCREEEPLTEIKIHEMTVDEMAQALAHGWIDAGFTVHPEPGEALRKFAVWQDRFAVTLPRNHPLLSLESIPRREIVRWPILLFHAESCPGGYDFVHQWLFKLPSSPKIAEGALSYEAMLMLAAAGYGIGVGLESQIALYKHPEVIVRPVADAPMTATFLVTPNRPPSATLNHFVRRVQKIGHMTHSQ
ncbi:MAG: LysR family transcriptional regulator [Candidatus Accumulibacter sp.]|jgi:DNA-binding transcriptional LysR family regulator|nr:LysR family transcriptional regulator [Accumulibacter sp.]